MIHKPEHSCFSPCARCAFDLGGALAKRKPDEACKYVWMVVGSDNPCDIRRYAFSYKEAVEQLAHARPRKYKDVSSNGVWTLFKLARVEKTGKKNK